MNVEFGCHRLELQLGDITRQPTDAIVNAANAQLAGGGGVDGALHRAAGPSLKAETSRLYPEGCPTGSAVITTAGALPVRYVIHAVAPIWRGGHHGERELLMSAYRSALRLAREHGCQSVAFPALGAGAYGYPMDLAAEHSLEAVREFFAEETSAPGLRVVLVLFDEGAYAAFARVLEQMVE